MRSLELIILLLFGCFFASAIYHIVSMLERKRDGRPLHWDRLLFFFFLSLMLVCLLPLWIFEILTSLVLISNLCVVLANGVGFALTYSYAREEISGKKEIASTELRAYKVYYQGRPYGVITREGFDQLMQFELLKKQPTVELIENYQQQARLQGVQVVCYKNRDRSQTLIKVEVLQS